MNKRFTGVVALGLAALLGFSACFGGGDNKKSSSSGAIGKPIRVGNTEANGLILPGTVRDTAGGYIIGNISAGLVDRDENGKIIMEAAESIETQDSINWTVKLKKDWKFTNGEPVNARSFVDSWNYIAKVSNAQGNRGGLRYIDGFAEDGNTDLSGLQVVDDYTFTIKLNTPLNDFVGRLSDTTFLPLPASAFKDMEAFGKNPIGAGAYILEDRKPNVSYKLKRNPDYKGYWKSAHPGYEVTIYQKLDASYADYLAGNIDFSDSVPSSSLSSFKTDSDGRYKIAEIPQQTMVSITGNTPGFGFDEAGKLRRKAVSMAINREEIADKIFKGLRKPANNFLPPKLYPQYSNLPGNEVLELNVQKAKELWAQAEAISPFPKDQKIKFAYNSDGGHKDWVDAVINQLRENLDMENLVDEPFPTFSGFLDAIAKEANYAGFLRFGWNYGYMPALTFEMLYVSDARYNYGYNNPELDRLVKQGITVPIDQASDIWGKAQEELLKDLPVIPLFNRTRVYVYGKDVKNVQLSAIGGVLQSRLTRE